MRLHLALRVCADPCFYQSLWLKCVVIFQRIVNTSSVSKSAGGLRGQNSFRTTTKVRLQALCGLIKGLENSNKLSLLPRLNIVYIYRVLIRVKGFSELKRNRNISILL